MSNIEHGTLVGSAVTTVTLDADAQEVEVLNRDGVAEIYFTVDGADPTVGGDDCHVLPAAIGALQVHAPGGGVTDIKLISSGTPKFSVRRVR